MESNTSVSDWAPSLRPSSAVSLSPPQFAGHTKRVFGAFHFLFFFSSSHTHRLFNNKSALQHVILRLRSIGGDKERRDIPLDLSLSLLASNLRRQENMGKEITWSRAFVFPPPLFFNFTVQYSFFFSSFDESFWWPGKKEKRGGRLGRFYPTPKSSTDS